MQPLMSKSIPIHHGETRMGLRPWNMERALSCVSTSNHSCCSTECDYSQGAQYHYDLANNFKLYAKVSINCVNGNRLLRLIPRGQMNDYFGFDWAIEADAKMQKFLLEHDHQSLINWDKQGQAFHLAIPTPDHYYPMIYALALQEDKDELSLFNTQAVGGSITMTSCV